jgi:phosphotransferase family enzyme
MVGAAVAEALSGGAGVEPVRRLLVGPPARRMLRREVGDMLADGYGLGPCRLRRAKFKPGRKLTAYYDVQLRDASRSPQGVRPVAVIWTAADEEAPPLLADIEGEAVARGVAAPFRVLHADGQDLSATLLVSPLDPRFPHLVPLSDPGFVADALGMAERRRCTVMPIRYRPGQRHVLRYDLDRGTVADRCSATIFAKLYEDAVGAQEPRPSNLAADWLELNGYAGRTLRPFAVLASGRAELYRGLDGAPLSRARGATGQLSQAGSLLRTLHLTPATSLRGLVRRDLADELRLVARASEHIDALLPATGASIRTLLDTAQELYERLPGEEPTFVQGDFKLDHLWFSAGRLTVIDFDDCWRGDPAFDVGKFLADLRWWYRRRGESGLAQAQQLFLDGYCRPRVPAARLTRARVYEAVFLAKIAARRLPLFDRCWEGRTGTLVGEAAALLHALQRQGRRPDRPDRVHSSLGRRAQPLPRRSARAPAPIHRRSGGETGGRRS